MCGSVDSLHETFAEKKQKWIQLTEVLNFTFWHLPKT